MTSLTNNAKSGIETTTTPRPKEHAVIGLRSILILAVMMIGSAVLTERAVAQTPEQLAASTEYQSLLQQHSNLNSQIVSLQNLLNSNTAYFFYSNVTQSYTTTTVAAVRQYIDVNCPAGQQGAWWDYYNYFHRSRADQLRTQLAQMMQDRQQMQERLACLWDILRRQPVQAVYRLKGGVPRIVASMSNVQTDTYRDFATVAAAAMTHQYLERHPTTGEFTTAYDFQFRMSMLPQELRQGEPITFQVTAAANASIRGKYLSSGVSAKWSSTGWADARCTNNATASVGYMLYAQEFRPQAEATIRLTPGVADTLWIVFDGPKGCQVIYEYERVQ